MHISKKINALFHPEKFQGWGKKKKYFEGWYFKIINAAETKAYAIIPGIALDDKGNKQSFIQVLDGRLLSSRYHQFSFESFVPSADKFRVAINNNHFSSSAIHLDLPDLKGKLEFSGNIPWPKYWYSPGIMGPFTFIPFMECKHGIVSMDHTINGELEVYGESLDFNNGRGYIEKDWGQSFPEGYIWMQSNHFSKPGISLKASVAKIPWIRNSFTGFIAGLWMNGRLIKFTTYNQSVLKKSFADSETVELVFENKKYRLEITAQRDVATSLASPIRGMMEGRIEESMSATIEIKLTDKKSQHLIFQDTGRNAGLEVAGNIAAISI